VGHQRLPRCVQAVSTTHAACINKLDKQFYLRRKKDGKWKMDLKPNAGHKIRETFDSELAAALRYDECAELAACLASCRLLRSHPPSMPSPRCRLAKQFHGAKAKLNFTSDVSAAAAAVVAAAATGPAADSAGPPAELAWDDPSWGLYLAPLPTEYEMVEVSICAVGDAPLTPSLPHHTSQVDAGALSVPAQHSPYASIRLNPVFLTNQEDWRQRRQQRCRL